MQASGPGSNCGGRNEIEREAARLLAKLLSDPKPQDEAELWAWVEADARHAVAFAKAQAAWDAAERLKCAATKIALAAPTDVVGEYHRRRASRKWWIAAAVAGTMIVIAALILLYSFGATDR